MAKKACPRLRKSRAGGKRRLGAGFTNPGKTSFVISVLSLFIKLMTLPHLSFAFRALYVVVLTHSPITAKYPFLDTDILSSRVLLSCLAVVYPFLTRSISSIVEDLFL